MLDVLNKIFTAVLGYLEADWYILLAGIFLAAIVSVYIDSNKLKNFFMRKAGLSIPGAVAVGALTPLCACGTMAVLLSMFVSAMPWGTVMAFLVSSPLTSPSEYMFETAFFGSRFATALLITSILFGILAGFIAHLLEKRTNFFKDQFRLGKQKEKSCSLSGADEIAAGCGCKTADEVTEPCGCRNSKDAAESCSCSVTNNEIQRNVYHCGCGEIKTACCGKPGFIQKYKLDKLVKELWNTGIKKILLYFILFIAVGRIVEMLIPQEWIMTLFGSNNAYSVPIAATIGLPLYLTDSSAMPLLKSFINSGAGEGAVLAFLIAGKATGVPVIAGMATFLKKKAMAFYLGFIYLGAILAGYLYQIIITV